MEQLADYIDRDIDARGKITGALIYPAVVFVMAVVTVIILATFVLPRFKTFFDFFHAKLPLPTRMLLSVSNFVIDWWFLLSAGSCSSSLGSYAATLGKGQGLARLGDPEAPGVGDLVQAVIMERICRILSSMIHAGVALPDAMAVTVRRLEQRRL